MGTHKSSVKSGQHRILIVDDHPVVRQGIRTVLQQEADLKVCGEAENAPEAIRLVREMHPDLVIIDLSLKAGSGYELLKQIKSFDPEIRMLVCSMHDEMIYAERVIRAGAQGYLRKDAAAANIIGAVRKVLSGEIYLSDAMTSRVLQRAAGGDNVDQPLTDVLTDRELQVVELIGQGKSTRQIAETLQLSIKTIETYRENLKSKLNLKSGTELSYWAVRWLGHTT